MKTSFYKIKITLVLFIAMLFGATNVQAQTFYDLKLCDVQVTSENMNDLTVINGVSGTANYNSITKTLRLENATIDADAAGSSLGILSYIDSIKIELVGNNTIKIAVGGSGIRFGRGGIITGGGVITIEGISGINTIIVNNTLTVVGCTVNAIAATTNGFSGANFAQLIIDSAFVTAGSAYYATISGFGYGITLNRCVISNPAGAQIIDGAICDADGNIIKDEIKIEPPVYDLWICGTRVSDVNKNDLSVINGVTGKVTYNSKTKTLRLENASITSTQTGIRSRLSGLKIDLVGNNTITINSSVAYGITLTTDSTFIRGSGNLTINVPSNMGIIVCEGALTIKGCTVNSYGKNGIYGVNTAYLIIDGANVKAKGDNNNLYGSIHAFKGITLNRCIISSPAGAKVTGGNITDAGGNIIRDTVKIEPSGVTAYDLYICGVQTTDVNMDALGAISGVSGLVSYNPNTKTLSLNGASITIPSGANAIKSSIEGLTIDVQNNNTVNSDGYATIRLEKSATINGNGTLNVSQTSGGWALFAYGSSFNIENCTVNATSDGRAITSNNISTLTINNATITAKGNVDGSITHFADIILIGCDVFEPAGAVVSSGTDNFVAVRDATGTIIKETVKIMPVYDLWICGTRVTTYNKDILNIIDGVSGTAKYDPETKKLSLEDATIAATGYNFGIVSEIDSLKIELIGNNTVTSTNMIGVLLDKFTTIEGNGVLNVNSPDIAIYVDTFLTIRNCKVNAKGSYGICGLNGEKETLIIDSAIISVTGSSNGSIAKIGEIGFINCAIIKPAGALFNTTLNAVCDAAGNIIKDTVKIVPATLYDLYVCGVQLNEFNKGDLTVIGGVTGMVNYNSDSRILRLENATINNTAVFSNGIMSFNGGVKIELVGNNSVISNSSAIVFNNFGGEEPCFIEGNGTLNVNSDSVAIETKVPLSIKNCTINAAGKLNGFYGYGSTLTFENAIVSAIGSEEGSIISFKEINFSGCDILKPINAVFNSDKEAICDAAGNIIKDTVKIMLVYIITFNTPENGSIKVMLGTEEINSGEEVFKNSGITITAIPNVGYVLNSLTVNSVNFESGKTHIVISDVNIVANFIVESGIEENAAKAIIFYPNPVQDILYIEAKETATAVNVYSLLGTIVAQSRGDVREINLANLPAGVYMVRVEMGKDVSTQRIIKK